MTDATLAPARPAMPRTVMVAIGFVGLFVLFALFGEFLSPHSFRDTSLLARLKPPAFLGGHPDYLLGTDQKGRDLLARLAVGAQISLIVAIVGTLLGAVIGSLLGILAAARRGWVEAVIMAAVDVQASLPIIIVALFVLAMFDNSFFLFLLLIGLSGWEVYARLMRGATLSAKEHGYALAIRALGASQFRVYLGHILPNVFNVALVQFTVNLPLTILLETALSFLGLGVQPPSADWGVMVKENLQGLLFGSAAALMPACAVASLTVSINLVADWFLRRMGEHISEEMLE